jgi:hypothetical protein
MWDSDIIEVVEILRNLEVKDNRMDSAIKLIKEKQQKNGRWILERTFTNRYLVKLEPKGKASKWITYRALNVLKKLEDY